MQRRGVPGAGSQEIAAQEVRVIEELLDLLRRVHELDEPCPVVGHRGVDRSSPAHPHELVPLLLGDGRIDAGAGVHPCKRPDPVPSLSRTELPDVRKLHVAPGTDLLREVLEVVGRVDLVEDERSICILCAQQAVIEVQAPVFPHDAQEIALESAERLQAGHVLQVQSLVQREPLDCPRQHDVGILSKEVPLRRGETLVDPAGYRPVAVDLFSRRRLDDLLPELAHQDGFPGYLGVGQCNADHVARGNRGVEAEQQVGCAQVVEVHGV